MRVFFIESIRSGSPLRHWRRDIASLLILAPLLKKDSHTRVFFIESIRSGSPLRHWRRDIASLLILVLSCA